jgi:hypothetical protein
MVVASLISGMLGKAGGDAAANAAMDAANQQREANALARKDLSPWREAGKAAINEAMQLLGLGRTVTGADGFETLDQSNRAGLQTEAAARFKTDPGFEFRRSEGQKAIDRSLASRGGALSGAAVKAGIRFADDTASQEYSNYFNRIMGVGTGGANAAGQSAAVGVQGAGLVGNDLIRAGQARQSGYNALASGVIRADNQLEKGFSKLFSFGAFG